MDVNELLEKHENLGKQLEKVPLYRKITYKEEMENGRLKPLFIQVFFKIRQNC